MKHTRPVAPMVRPSMLAPLSDPRLRFMTATPDGPAGVAVPEGDAAPPTEGQPAGEPSETPPAGDNSAQPPADDFNALPEWAQKQIRDLRAENAKDRTSAKQNAAQEARDALAQDIGKALGLVKDDSTTPDPEQLTKQVAEAQATAAQKSIELAIYQTASAHEGDPKALLDSRSFLEKVSSLDPASGDFQTHIGEAIKQAVTDNPKLKTASQVPGRSGGEIRGGTPSPTEQTPESLAALIRKKRTY